MRVRVWLIAALAVCGVAAFAIGAGAALTEGGINRDGMAYIIARGVAGFEAFVPPAEPTFPDVPASHWAYKEIEFGAAQGFWTGYPDGQYRPEVATLRAQATVFLDRAAALPLDSVATPTFADVPVDHWAFSYVEALAADIGVETIQWSDGLFRPDSPITNLELAEWTQAALGASGDPSAVPFFPAAVDPPTCDFSATPTSGAAPLEVTFTDLSAGSPSPASWSWTFGDGQGSTDRNPVHTYAGAGSYTVSLTAANAAGGANTTTKTDCVVVVGPPAPSFTATPAKGTAPLTVTFTDTSTGNPTAWSWDFGDGGASTDRNPTHEYARAGKYTVSLTASSGGGSATATTPGCVLVVFSDLLLRPWAFSEVMACTEAGIVGGYPDGDYHPSAEVTRDQMAVYIARAMAGGDGNVPEPSVSTPTFPDVDSEQWAYRYVEYCAAADIVQGYPNGDYRPTETVNRGQMAVYIARSVATPTGDAGVPPVPAGTPPTFSDVTADNDAAWCYQYVEYCAAEGIVQGYWNGTYRPTDAVTRDQMAVYVTRAFDLPITDLANPFAGTYAANYEAAAPGYITIVVDVLGNVSIVIIDPTYGAVAGTGAIDESGELTATIEDLEGLFSTALSGQFVNEGGTLSASGSLAGTVSATWTARRVAEAGVNAFAGNWSGNYVGSEFGPWQGTVQADGSVAATAHSPSAGQVVLTGTVTPAGYAAMEGSGTGAAGPFTIAWSGALYLYGENVVGAGRWESTSGMYGGWSGQLQTGAPSPFAGTYAMSYGTAGCMTIAVDESGCAGIVIVDPVQLLLVGTGLVSDSGELWAAAGGYLTSATATISGQFTAAGESYSASGSLSGDVTGSWAGGRIAAGGVNAFAGNWSGTFSGSASGTFQATVHSDGSATVASQSPTAGSMTSTGEVAPAGFILAWGQSGSSTITWGGALYMQGGNAVAAGLWGSSSGASGDWEGARH